MDQVGTVEELHRRAGALCGSLPEWINTTDDPLLANLRFADELVHQAETLRTLLLRHARRRGASWTAISAATGVAATTWRDRYTAHLIRTERTA